MKTYKIYLIRHAITAGNLKGQYIGTTDLPIIPEAVSMLKAMKEKYVYPEVTEYFTSPLLRCRQTLAALYPDAKPIIVPELKEYDFGDFEQKTPNDLKNDEIYNKWINGTEGEDPAPPNGESNSQFINRICQCFNTIVEHMMRDSVTEAVICTHGGVISSILATYGLPQRSIAEWECLYGKGYCITIQPSIWMRGGMFEVSGYFPFEK